MGHQTLIYLDNSATTRVRNEVQDAMEPFQNYAWGNASSQHRVGRQSRAAIDNARRQVASLIGAMPDEIFFTPSATYSNNVALLGRARYVEEHGLGRHIITSSIEHSSVLAPIKHLQSRGWDVTILGVDSQGFVDPVDLERSIRPDTSIISIMWGNNEIGTLQPIQRIADIAKQHGVFFHTDAVQVAGKLPIDVSQTNVDALSITGHKLYAPKGIGALYIRRGVTILPVVFGGGQESGMFPGTENVANIVGLGTAAQLAADEMLSEDHLASLASIQKLFIDRLSRFSKVKLTGALDLSRRIPGHISFALPGSLGTQICEDADELGLCISSVSACSSGGGHPSHVLEALGMSEKHALGAVRISAGWFNSIAECQRAVRILSNVLARHSLSSNDLTGTIIDLAPESITSYKQGVLSVG
jgi:cysteine desulfurase